MTSITNKKTMLSVFGIVLLSAMVVSSPNTLPNTYAETQPVTKSNFTVLEGDDLKNNPIAKTMLDRIEVMKQRIAEMQNKKEQMTEQQKFIEEQRKIVKQLLAEELNRMNDKYKDHTPKAAFTSFVSKTPESVHNVFWGMYEYRQSKVDVAHETMNEMLDSGSSMQEARDAFNSLASSKRTDLIEVTKNLNIQHGLADSKVQMAFDQYGKLPRSE